MKKSVPFLINFAKPCCSPGRQPLNPSYRYDNNTDMVHWLGSEEHPPAIDLSGIDGPMTKKCDIEKGDDNKDRRMWQ